jgi:hypothetical protein
MQRAGVQMRRAGGVGVDGALKQGQGSWVWLEWCLVYLAYLVCLTLLDGLKFILRLS